MVDKLTPKARADKVLDSLLKGKDLFDNAKAALREQVPISGKSVSCWEKQFKILLPDENDMNPALVFEFTMKILRLLQDATFYHAEANRYLAYLKRGADGAYHHAYWTLVEDFKNTNRKIPAAATLESLARVEVVDNGNALVIAETEVRYWKHILDHLDRSRKLLEAASFSINNELRSSHQANFLEKSAQRNGE